MRKLLPYLLFLISTGAIAQQRPTLSQYMFNGLLINPAYAGIYHEVNVSLLHRQQWINIEGAPMTSTFTFHTDINQTKAGAGLMTYMDQVGAHRDLGVFGSYSYKLDFGFNRKLSMGMSLGFNQIRTDFTQLTVRDLSDPFYGTVQQAIRANAGVGAFYYTDNFYVGASVPYILEPTFLEGSVGGYERTYFLSGGMLFRFGKRLVLKPSTLIRIQEGQALGFDLNGYAYIDNAIAFGVSVRSEGSMVGLFEVKINEQLRFGYAFDYVAGRLDRFTDGTHELLINYRFMWPKVARNDQLCPTYY